MRSAIWGILAVFIASLALCIGTLIAVKNVTTEMQARRNEAIELVQKGDVEPAMSLLTSLIDDWEISEQWMSTFIAHNDLHEITESLSEAQILLDVGERDDFLRAMAYLEEKLTHIYEEQRLKLVNIL